MKTLYDDLNERAKEFSKDKFDCRLQMNKSTRKYINKVEKKLFDLVSKGIDCDVKTEFHGFENPTEYPRLVYCWS
jgi:hypothetical protein